jgi:hypothetical protein
MPHLILTIVTADGTALTQMFEDVSDDSMKKVVDAMKEVEDAEEKRMKSVLLDSQQ